MSQGRDRIIERFLAGRPSLLGVSYALPKRILRRSTVTAEERELARYVVREIENRQQKGLGKSS